MPIKPETLLLQRQCRETPEKMSKTAEGNAAIFFQRNKHGPGWC